MHGTEELQAGTHGQPPGLPPPETPDPDRRDGRLRIGNIDIDRLRFDEALDAIAGLVERGQGGSVFTPNIDHVVLAEHDAAFLEAYRHATLSLADGMPILWAARLLGKPIPEKVSGSDLILPLMGLAALHGWRIYLLGGAPGVAEEAAAAIRARYPVEFAGIDAPPISVDPDDPKSWNALARIAEARPEIVLVALGAPKQEVWIHRNAAAFGPAVVIGVGASLDFIAGRVPRAPPWMSQAGLEWLYRLVHEPRRLWRRYLLRDPEFLGILLRTWRMSRVSTGAIAKNRWGIASAFGLAMTVIARKPIGPTKQSTVRQASRSERAAPTADPHTAYRQSNRFPSLDGLRAISIVAVIWHHASGATAGVLSRGRLGVELFFVISGYLITTLLLREAQTHGAISLPRFYQRRALRIFPLYYAVLLLYVLLVRNLEPHSAAGIQFFGDLPAFATYTSNWFVDRNGGARVIFYFAWSLATEEQFYLVWPWVLRFSRRWQVPCGVAILLVIVKLLVDQASAAGLVSASALAFRVASSIAMAICLGCLIAYTLHFERAFRLVWRAVGTRWSAPLAIAALIACIAVPGVPELVIYLAMAYLVAACCARPDHTLAGLFANRSFVYVGTISYGMYLLHMIALHVVRLLPKLTGLETFALTLLLTVALATVSYRFFEHPFLRLKRRLRADAAPRLVSTPSRA
jgi:exopolysaccharide biosynthesis WecB/TagA/CpsF family protein